jgi:hypothetical protein
MPLVAGSTRSIVGCDDCRPSLARVCLGRATRCLSASWGRIDSSGLVGLRGAAVRGRGAGCGRPPVRCACQGRADGTTRVGRGGPGRARSHGSGGADRRRRPRGRAPGGFGDPSCLHGHLQLGERTYHVNRFLLAAIHFQESRFSTLRMRSLVGDAVTGGWNACGAAGPMQMGIVGVPPYRATTAGGCSAGATWLAHRLAFRRSSRPALRGAAGSRQAASHRGSARCSRRARSAARAARADAAARTSPTGARSAGNQGSERPLGLRVAAEAAGRRRLRRLRQLGKAWQVGSSSGDWRAASIESCRSRSSRRACSTRRSLASIRAGCRRMSALA